MSADKDRGIRRQKQKRAKVRKKPVPQPHPPTGVNRSSTSNPPDKPLA